MEIHQYTDPDQLLDTNQTAALLGLHPFTLHRWRCNGDRTLPWTKVGGRIRYRRADIQVFTEAGYFGRGPTPTRPFGSRDPASEGPVNGAHDNPVSDPLPGRKRRATKPRPV